MPYSVQAKNLMLDALTALGLHVSAHSGLPGSTGANEIAGTTRQALGFTAAAAGTTAHGPESIPGIPSGTSVQYLGVWKHATSTLVADYIGYQAVTSFTGSGVTWVYDVAAGALDLNALASA